VSPISISIHLPKTTNHLNAVESEYPIETYHVDFSLEARYIAFSRGAKLDENNLHGLVPEFPGIEAPGWNSCIADARNTNRWVQITFDVKTNKEPDWQLAKSSKGSWFSRLFAR
jgi:hypothetical protein